MNNLFPYSIKKKKKINWRLIFVTGVVFLAIITILKIDSQVKKIPFNYELSTKEAEVSLEHKFNPREKEIEIVKDNGKLRIVSPQEIIREVSAQENFRNSDYLIRLCDCESSLGERMLNTKGNYPVTSKDRGWFQINSYWHKEIPDECAYSLRCATKFAIKLIQSGQVNQFACSKLIQKYDY